MTGDDDVRGAKEKYEGGELKSRWKKVQMEGNKALAS